MNDFTHITCVCTSPEHTLRFSFDEEEKEVYTEVYLKQYRGFFKRVWIALKYIFGYSSRYGHWDCTIMNDAESRKLHGFLEYAIKEMSREKE